MAGKEEIKKLTIQDIFEMKVKGEKITQTTAYDFNWAKILDESEIELLGIGSVGPTMVLGGKLTSVIGTMEDALFVMKMAVPAVRRAIIVCGLPFGTYQVSNEQAVKNAITLMKAGADSVKTEGAGIILDRIKAISDAGIPVAGHLGLTPQYVSKLGGYHSVGKRSEEAVKIYKDALLMEQAGAWYIELECVPHLVAEVISKQLKVPTIGVGSGTGCDGQSLISHDILGLQRTIQPKLAKKYIDLWSLAVKALKEFRYDVKQSRFPTKAQTFEISDEEFNKFTDKINL